MGFCFCLVCSLSSEHRDTEAFESVAEDEQLPQVLDELHDLFLSPGAPIAKMSVRVKGQFFFFSWMQIVLFQILFYLYFVYVCTVYSKCFLFYICTCRICYSTPAALSIMTLMSYILFSVHPIFNYLVCILNTHSHSFASKTTLIFSCYIAEVKWRCKHNFMFNTILQDFPHQEFTGSKMAPHFKPPAELYCRPSEITTVLRFWMLSGRTPENTQHTLAI